METKDHNNKSRNDPKTCKFYDELEEVLGKKPCVKPIAIASNLKRTIVSTSSTENSEDISEESGSATQNKASLSKKKKRKMTRIQREFQDWSTALLADAKAREEARER